MAAFTELADLAITLHGVEVVEECQSTLQSLVLLRHPKLGLVFVINDEVQHAQAWQALYHEPLVHLAGSFVPELKQALVLGGGSLFAAFELLRYPTLERCTLVDHDRAVLELMARHYDHARQVLEDPRFTYVSEDALSFVLSTDQSFDLIVNDCLDLTAVRLADTGSVFAALRGRLTARGVCSDLIYRHILEREHLAVTKAALFAIGPSAWSLVCVPEYPGALHALAIWGTADVTQSATRPANLVQRRWCKSINRPDLEYYDPRFLPFHLYLPPSLRSVLVG